MFGRDWEILIGIGAREMPVSIRKILSHLKIKALSYDTSKDFLLENNLSSYMDNDAFSFKNGKAFIIFYNEKIPEEALRIAILHEVAHIICGHVEYENDSFDGKCTTFNKTEERDFDIVEEAAYNFALKLLAPSCVLWALKIKKSHDIEKLCFVPKKFARMRLERMKELYQREKEFLAKRGTSCFLLSRKEKVVYQNFKPYIEKMKTLNKKL